jgi:CHAT domain-containing protein
LPAGVRDLFIVPDDLLIHVPFAALSMGPDGGPLCATYRLSMVPYPRWTARRAGPPTLETALGVAVTRSSAEGHEDWAPLPGAAVEVAALARLPGAQVRLLRDGEQEATLAAVRSALSGQQLVHFACHGEFFPIEPDASGLLLKDGWLTVREIEGFSLPALKVAVLGSCWGASTRVLPGREMVGLAASFLRRGCRELVTALWEFREEAGTRFAAELYVELPRQGLAASVASLQTRWSRDRPPAEWAAFRVYGEGVPVVGWARLWIRLRLGWRRLRRALFRRRGLQS